MRKNTSIFYIHTLGITPTPSTGRRGLLRSALSCANTAEMCTIAAAFSAADASAGASVLEAGLRDRGVPRRSAARGTGVVVSERQNIPADVLRFYCGSARRPKRSGNRVAWSRTLCRREDFPTMARSQNQALCVKQRWLIGSQILRSLFGVTNSTNNDYRSSPYPTLNAAL